MDGSSKFPSLGDILSPLTHPIINTRRISLSRLEVVTDVLRSCMESMRLIFSPCIRGGSSLL